MAYTDFTLEPAEATLGIACRPGDLFPGPEPSAVPGWLSDSLGRGMRLAPVGERARSEFIIAPLLSAVREAAGDRVATVSGQRLDVDSERRLVGECDFPLAHEPVPRLRAPRVAAVEATENDIGDGLGRCVAQVVAARIHDERAGEPLATACGCATTGEGWQFLGLSGTAVTLHRPRPYIDSVGAVLAAFARAVGQRG